MPRERKKHTPKKTPRGRSKKAKAVPSSNGDAAEKTPLRLTEYPPPPTDGGEGLPRRADDLGEGWILASAIPPGQAEFFWRPYLPRASVCLVAGESEVGKSCFGARLVAGVTLGGWPEGGSSPGYSLVLPGEEDLATQVLPRLIAAGANMGRVIVRPSNVGWPLRFPGSEDELRSAVESRGARFVFVDPLTSYCSHGYSLNDEQQTREVLDCFVRVAHATRCCVLVGRNLRKGEGAPLERIIGSVAFQNLPRSILLAVNDPASGERVLIHGKSNVGPRGASIAYDLAATTHEAPVWTPTGEVPLTLEQLGPAEHDPGRRDEHEAAVAFIRAFLSEQWERSTDVIAAGEKERISAHALRRAAKELGIEVQRKGRRKEHHSLWRAPEGWRK